MCKQNALKFDRPWCLFSVDATEHKQQQHSLGWFCLIFSILSLKGKSLWLVSTVRRVERVLFLVQVQDLIAKVFVST